MDKTQTKRIMRHVPNALTLGRLVLTVVFLALIIHAGRPDAPPKPDHLLLGAFVLFVITALTDIVDGHLARRFEVTSKFGRIVDPLADKFLVCGAFFCFAWVNEPKMDTFGFSGMTLDVIRWGTAVTIFAREVVVQTIRYIAESRGVHFGAIWSGKLKMFLQSFGIGTVLIGWAYVSRPWGDWFTLITYALMVFATVLSGIQSLTRRIK